MEGKDVISDDVICPATVQIRPVLALLNEGGKDMVGKVLIQLEAAIPAEKQCVALKSVVKRIIWDGFTDAMTRIQDLREDKQ